MFQFGDKDKSIVVDGQYQSVDAFKNINIPLTLAGGQGQSQSQSDNKQNSAMSDVNQASPQQNSKTSASNNISGMPTAKLGDLADITVSLMKIKILMSQKQWILQSLLRNHFIRWLKKHH
ncbi:RND multidrug efflux transporter; Acriflavin resistance protein [Staphylococcus aureus]|nr:RND multidrug efflux transporter; Acriflavin resistance protein [Staphylococcus aureus]